MPSINPDRLLGDLYELRKIGAYKTGVHRPTLSPEDIESRQWLAERMKRAGLEPVIDGIANVIGLSRAGGRKMLAGSHVETQNHAGWLDGALGVIYALEAARAFAEDKTTAWLGVDVVAFADEEGHFGNFMGSRSFVGVLSEEDIDKARDRTNGTPLRDALAKAGYVGRPRLQIDPSRYAGYFEAHIEQGDTLETTGLRIGVVTAIVAIRQYRIRVTGEQNHAGTASMARRRDAGLALVRLLATIDQRFPEVAGERSVWTTGRITLSPGDPSIVPGGAEALFQFRDTDPAVLERMHAALVELIAQANRDSRCPIELVPISASTPAVMDEGFQAALDKAAERHAPGKHVRMPSGAGHDAQYLARKIPAAMMFVPSIGGISHHWAENTSDEDIVLGARVFVDAIAEVLRSE
jgi:beta-ureidopropionase / N-carbamoyl-L-amino-acid hydrolase